jgi:hypothetical protein
MRERHELLERPAHWSKSIPVVQPPSCDWPFLFGVAPKPGGGLVAYVKPARRRHELRPPVLRGVPDAPF